MSTKFAAMIEDHETGDMAPFQIYNTFAEAQRSVEEMIHDRLMQNEEGVDVKDEDIDFTWDTEGYVTGCLKQWDEETADERGVYGRVKEVIA